MDDIAQRIVSFERRFLISTIDGLCVDWILASKDQKGFAQYIRDRQWVRIFKGVI